LIIPLLQVEFGEKLGTRDLRGEIGDVWKRITVRDRDIVETTVVPTGPPGTVLLLDHV